MYRSRVFYLLLAASLMLGMASYASAAVVVFRECAQLALVGGFLVRESEVFPVKRRTRCWSE